MLWRRSVPAQTLSAPGPVPDTNAIRQMLLQASWQRDRWVVRRRVAVRWTLWFLGRYLLPALLALAAAAFIWLWLLPRWTPAQLAHPPRQVSPPAPAAPPAPASEPVATPRHTPLVAVPEPPAERPSETAESAETALQLRLQSELPQSGASMAKAGASQPRPSAAAPDKFPTPKLTPDNWLHSKEP